MYLNTKDILNKTVSTERYLTELRKPKYDPIPKEEELKYIEEYQKTGDINARDKVINANTRIVISVAHEYQGQNICVDDLINEGNIGMIYAMDKFKTDLGNKFISYAIHHIRARMSKYIIDNDLIRIPLNAFNDAKKTGDVLVKSISLNSTLNNTDDSKLEDILEDKNCKQPDYNFTKFDVNRMLDVLLPYERYVIVNYFGLEGKKQLNFKEMEHLDENECEFTSQWYRQLYGRAIRRIKMHFPEFHKIENLLHK
jgi:RNA polymerase sigma factor (sigma-70 family)